MYKLTIVALLLVSFIATFAASSKIVPPGGPCDIACLAVFDPVCGYNGKIYKSFGNDCEMNRENCDKPIKFVAVDLSLCN
ncbi:unnamed protein product [Hermetia illucens]|uniref:Kazal-like domain-containing protein n=1 Tax=Hermetia illucens TaxID=343691 RepID=A0A7R8YQ00_HERIL|nr:vasotab-like [Hermetia illucens]CAD7081291.1 unnamed protein product [Hermetia illucens]